MSVYREKKVWRYEIQVSHKRYCGWGFKTKREAKEAAEQRRRQLRLQKPDTPSLRDLVQSYFHATNQFKTIDWNTDQRRILNKIFAHLYNMPITAITSSLVNQAIAAHGNRVGAVTLNKYRNVISAIFQFAIDQEYLDRNPVKAVRRRPQPAPQPLVPTGGQIQQLLSVADGDLEDELICQLYTLGRLQDVLRIRSDDVDFARRILVMRTRKRRGGHEHLRFIPITEPLFAVLKARKLRAGKSPFLFPQHNKRRWYEDLEKACKQAGIPRLGFHSIRHHQARLLNSEGVDLPTIQTFLGHSSLTVTARYVQALTSSMKAAGDTLMNKTTRANHTLRKTSDTA